MNTPVAQKKIAKLQIQICLLNSLFFYWRFIYSYKNFIRVFMIVMALLIERAKLMFDCTMHASFFSPSFFLRPVCIFSGSFPFILIANRWEISDDQCIYIDELAIIKIEIETWHTYLNSLYTSTEETTF